jgi:hypothetical protein
MTTRSRYLITTPGLLAMGELSTTLRERRRHEEAARGILPVGQRHQTPPERNATEGAHDHERH